ncbi:hypothetical protein J2T09_003261 [Neorhizobium huautlense]|uniref:Uncharacterized protein n=1 Tax=Neorhizobium huautlense TaxID=67774 RepID=A0ABT9PVJ7_9HYPH|nr:hypothetical protein [Neorhizobium huautlense]MDP9838493.1 hypothetical protein [Neorhizobium huautlense]
MKQTARNVRSAEQAAFDLEARMVVLEIVSMTSLALALDTSENGNAEQARGIMGLIVETVQQRCSEMGMSPEASHSAERYAQQLLSTALLSLFPDGH